MFLRASERQQWPAERPPADELEGSKALIIGYGEIGREIGSRLRPFGVNVTAVRRQPPEEPGVIGRDDWRHRLSEFDYVIVSAAFTPQTRHLLGATEFARMHPRAWVFNVSRGGLVDHLALAEALRAGHLRGAYLDVTEP